MEKIKKLLNRANNFAEDWMGLIIIGTLLVTGYAVASNSSTNFNFYVSAKMSPGMEAENKQFLNGKAPSDSLTKFWADLGVDIKKSFVIGRR